MPALVAIAPSNALTIDAIAIGQELNTPTCKVFSARALEN